MAQNPDLRRDEHAVDGRIMRRSRPPYRNVGKTRNHSSRFSKAQMRVEGRKSEIRYVHRSQTSLKRDGDLHEVVLRRRGTLGGRILNRTRFSCGN